MDPLIISLSPAIARTSVASAIQAAYRNRRERQDDVPTSVEAEIDVPPTVATAEALPSTATVGLTATAEVVKKEIQDDLDKERKAQLVLYSRTQYGVYAVFQALVIALAFASTLALVICIIRLIWADQSAINLITEVGVAVGSIATGGAARFIQKQATEAKERYLEALKLF